MITKEAIDQAIYEVICERPLVNSYGEDISQYIRLFDKIYNKYGYVYDLNYDTGEFAEPIKLSAHLNRKLTNNNKRRRELFSNIKEYSKGIVRNFLKEPIVFTDNYMYTINECLICIPEDYSKIQKELFNLIPEEEKCIPTFNYVMCANGNIDFRPIEINEVNCDIALNYNDDLPYDRIIEVLKAKSSSLSIYHGIPGGGKSTFIRKLIADNSDLNFYWLDAKMLSFANDASFINFLTNNSNSVYIIEDCEFLLRSRDEGDNSILSTLLNISDGLLGDSLNIKFICTFNTNLENIDKALLRKGRLKVKYEFKELCEEKVKVLADKLGINIQEIKPMPLCEIYNYQDDNGNKSRKPIRKVGFSV